MKKPKKTKKTKYKNTTKTQKNISGGTPLGMGDVIQRGHP